MQENKNQLSITGVQYFAEKKNKAEELKLTPEITKSSKHFWWDLDIQDIQCYQKHKIIYSDNTVPLPLS